MKKLISILIALVVVMLFAVTTPKTFADYGINDPRRQVYYKIDNYLLFSTCSTSYQRGTVWKVHQIGVLGMTIKVKDE